MRIEKELPGTLPIVYLACRRHKLERDFNAAFRAVFPGPTKAPADRLCEKVHTLAEKGEMPQELNASPYVFRSETPHFKRQRDRMAAVAEKMDRTGETSGALPRDDYCYMLNIVKVE